MFKSNKIYNCSKLIITYQHKQVLERAVPTVRTYCMFKAKVVEDSVGQNSRKRYDKISRTILTLFFSIFQYNKAINNKPKKILLPKPDLNRYPRESSKQNRNFTYIKLKVEKGVPNYNQNIYCFSLR